MKKRIFFMFILLLSFGFILAACGGGNSDDTASEASTSEEESAEAAGSSGDSSDSEGEAAGGGSGETYTFKYGHISSEENVWHTQALKFAEELERLSDGRMSIEFFPMGQLGNENDMLQQLEAGTLDFAIITTAQLSNYSDDLNAWALPFMFESVEEGIEMSKTEPARQILDNLEDLGLVGLGYNFVGNRYIMMIDSAVETPEDLNGKKIRITGGPSVQDFWIATGASPESMPRTEIYTSLQTGVIDGIEIDFGSILEEKYYEVANHLTLTNHYAFTGIDVMSKAVFDSLPPEDQEIILEAARIAEEWGGEDTIKAEEEHLEELKEAGVNIYEFPYVDNFTDIQEEIFEKYSDNEITKAFIDAYKEK